MTWIDGLKTRPMNGTVCVMLCPAEDGVIVNLGCYNDGWTVGKEVVDYVVYYCLLEDIPVDAAAKGKRISRLMGTADQKPQEDEQDSEQQ